jgi:hypothetical protein
MAFLADDLLEGRGTGTRGHRLAALYVASQFGALGFEPGADGTYFQSMRLVQAIPREAACSLDVVGRGKEWRLNYGTDFVMFIDPLGPDAVLQAPVVFVGYGVSAPEETTTTTRASTWLARLSPTFRERRASSAMAREPCTPTRQASARPRLATAQWRSSV